MPVTITMAPVSAAMPPSSAATSMLMAVVTDLGSRGGILLTGQVQRKRQSQCTAKAHQRAHRNARNDGGGILFQQVDLLIQRDGQCHRGGQQQVIHRCCADLIVRIGDLAHRKKHDDKNAAQQQRVEDGLAGQLIDEGAQRKKRPV